MSITLDGTNGITAPTYGSAVAAEYLVPVTGFKNRIINGAMVIDQRNAGASVTPTDGQFSVDRWSASLTQASKFTAQQNAGAVTPPVGFINYLGITSSSAYSVLAGDTFLINQAIEGLNATDLGFGSASASTITLSFWVRSSLTGSFGGAILNSARNRNYLFNYTISSANTWTQISVTIAGDTSGTWLTTNGIGILVRFGLGSGSTYSGTANTWQAGNLVQPTSSVSVVGTNGATFYITGVQLEKGSTATSFDYRPYGTELALCQRYYEIGGNANSVQFCSTVSISTTYFTTIPFIVTKRASATVVNTNVNNNAMPTTPSSATASATEVRNSRVSNGASANGYFGDSWTASAEL